jgi:flagellar basal body-associated protein FliL
MKGLLIKNNILVIILIAFVILLLSGMVKSFGLYEGMADGSSSAPESKQVPVAQVYNF